jgi:hypothetical protein
MREPRAARPRSDLHLPSEIAFFSLPRAGCLSRLLGELSDERRFSGDSKLDGRERAEDEAKQYPPATSL